VNHPVNHPDGHPTKPSTEPGAGVAERSHVPGPPSVVPRQRRRDAYELYAEIYALQREMNRDNRS
jgi:hypothetical protein